MRLACCFPYTHKDDACAKKTPTKQTSLPPSDSGRSMQSVICAGNRVWIGGAFFLTVAQSQRQRGDMQARTLQQPFSQRSKRTLVSPNRKRGLRVVFHTPTKMMRAQKRLQRNKRHFLLPTPEGLCSRLSARSSMDRRGVPLSLQSRSPKGSAAICKRDIATTFFSKIEKNLVSPNRKRGLCVVFHTPTKMMHAQRGLQRNKRHSFLPTPEALCSRLSARGIEYRSAGRPSFLTVAQSQRQRGDMQEGPCNNLFLKDRKELLFLPTASEACLLFSIHPQR